MPLQANRKVPKIRFQEFDGNWSKKTLGEIVEFLDELRRPLKAADRKAGPYPYYGASGIIDYVDAFLFDEMLLLFSEDGANIIDRNSPICFLAEGKYWVNNHAHVLRANAGFSYYFVRDSLERINYEQFNTGTAQPKLNQEVCRNIRLNVACFSEQMKIGSYFKSLDQLIQLHQQKHDKLVTLKQAMLQKMFPQDGANVPEIRFKGFEEPWQNYQLGDMTAKIGSGKTPKGGKSVYASNGVPLLRSQNVVNDLIDFEGVVFISDQLDEEMSNSRVLKDDVLLNITGASIGRSAVYRYCEPANVNQHVCIIRVNGGYDSEFIQLNLTSNGGQRAINNSQAGGGREGLNFQQIGKFSFQFPTLREQATIGSYFRKLGVLIDKHATQLEKLKDIKASCLEKLFV